MRFAVFSDVHANLPALKAVLLSIEALGIDNIFCLGDLVDFAPWQNECIALIRERKIPVVCGNHDKRVAYNQEVTPLAWHSLSEQNARSSAINYSKSTLSPDNRVYLQALPFSLTVDVGDKHDPYPILFVHASTSSLSEYIYENHPVDDLLNRLHKENVKVIISGHTHIAYIRDISNGNEKFIIANTGAVGRIKKGQPKATWLEGHFENGALTLKIHETDYDLTEVTTAIISSDIPDYYAENLLLNSPHNQ